MSQAAERPAVTPLGAVTVAWLVTSVYYFYQYAMRSAPAVMWLRYVLVPGLTDVDDEMRQMAEFAASLGVVERVEILPFHQLGEYKWERLGLDYQLVDTKPPSGETIARAIGIFQDAGLSAS